MRPLLFALARCLQGNIRVKNLDLDKALKNADKKVIKQRIRRADGTVKTQLYPFWSTDPLHTANLSVGAAYYFRYLQIACYIFCGLALVSCFMIGTNNGQTGYPGPEGHEAGFTASLGNHFRTVPISSQLDACSETSPNEKYCFNPDCTSQLRADTPMGYTILDMVMALIYVTLLLLLPAGHSRQDMKKVRQEHNMFTTGAFSMEFRGFPECTTGEIIDFFSANHGPVASVCVVLRDGNVLEVQSRELSHALEEASKAANERKKRQADKRQKLANTSKISSDFDQVVLPSTNSVELSIQTTARNTVAQPTIQQDPVVVASDVNSEKNENLEISVQAAVIESAHNVDGSQPIITDTNESHDNSNNNPNVPEDTNGDNINNSSTNINDPTVNINSRTNIISANLQIPQTSGDKSTKDYSVRRVSQINFPTTGTGPVGTPTVGPRIAAAVRRLSTNAQNATTAGPVDTSANDPSLLVHPLVCYVTFMDYNDATKTIFAYRRRARRFCRLCNCFQPPRFKNAYLKGKRAKEPSDVIWENLHYASCNKFFRQSLGLFITCALLAASYFVWRVIDDVNRSSQKGTFKARRNSIIFGVFSAIYNQFLQLSILFFSNFGKHFSHSARENQVFWFKFIMNLLQYIVFVFLTIQKLPNQDCVDWYVQGSVVIYTMLVTDAVLGVLEKIFQPVYLVQHAYWMVKARNQQEFNRAWEGPVLQLWSNYASFLSTVFITFIYSSVLPALVLISFFKLAALYMVEKYNLLRLYQRPRAMDNRMAEVARSVLPVAVSLKILLSLTALISSVFKLRTGVPYFGPGLPLNILPLIVMGSMIGYVVAFLMLRDSFRHFRKFLCGGATTETQGGLRATSLDRKPPAGCCRRCCCCCCSSKEAKHYVICESCKGRVVPPKAALKEIQKEMIKLEKKKQHELQRPPRQQQKKAPRLRVSPTFACPDCNATLLLTCPALHPSLPTRDVIPTTTRLPSSPLNISAAQKSKANILTEFTSFHVTFLLVLHQSERYAELAVLSELRARAKSVDPLSQNKQLQQEEEDNDDDDDDFVDEK